MPRVTLHLYAGFRQYAGGRASVCVPVEPGDTIASLLQRYDIPLDQVRIVFCDHRITDVTRVLEGGETVGAFPAVGGG
jgi:hypothetical protein